jgi:peptidyl-prolyl cis-trans isomerase C
MKRSFLLLAAAVSVLPLAAQTAATTPAPAAVAAPQPKLVASINGEVITQEKLDQLYMRLGTQTRTQYDQNGGKQAFLENYLRKRLLVQEAIKAGFDKRPDVQADLEAAKESALFDRYVRDVVSQAIVPDTEIRKYYDENQEQFKTPEMVRVSHIIIIPNGAGPKPKTDAQAQELIQQAAAELRTQNVVPAGTDEETAARLVESHFAAVAKKYSEDVSAQSGGDLGWNPKGVFDKDFEDAAFNLRPHMISGVIKSRFGYHLILANGRKPAGVEPFEEARPTIREFLMTQHQAEVVEAVARMTNDLRTHSNIRVYPENIH